MDITPKDRRMYSCILGKPIISKKNPKYRKGKRGIQTLCHLHYDEVLIKQGRHPNIL